MGNIQFYDSKILFGDSDGLNTDKIAMDPACCCPQIFSCAECKDSDIYGEYTVTIPDAFTPTNCDVGGGDCAAVIGDFVVQSLAASRCHFNIWLDTTCRTGATDYELILDFLAGRVLEAVLRAGVLHLITWRTTLPDAGGGKADCLLSSGAVSLPYVSEGVIGDPARCAWDGATALTVTPP